MVEKRKQYKVYLTDRNIALLKAERDKTGQSTTDLINALIDSYFKGLIASEVVKNTDEAKIEEILNMLKSILQVCNADYRSTTYCAELLTLKSSNDEKNVARKKATKNFGKLRNNELVKEGYFEGSDESDAYTPENDVRIPTPERESTGISISDFLKGRGER